jgi:hypothetical protein
LWVWLAGIERPPAATITGGVIVICAVVFQVRAGTAWRRRELLQSCRVGAELRVRSDE